MIRSEPDDRKRATNEGVVGSWEDHDSGTQQALDDDWENVFDERVAFQWNQYTAPCDDTEGLGHEVSLKLEAKIDEIGTSVLRMEITFAPLGKLHKQCPGVVLWDSGAGSNFVRSNLVALDEFAVERLQELIEIALGTSYSTECTHQVQLEIDLNGLLHVGWFYLINDLSEDVIFSFGTYVRYYKEFDFDNMTFKGRNPEPLPLLVGNSEGTLQLNEMEAMNAKLRNDSGFVQIWDEDSDLQIANEMVDSKRALIEKNAKAWQEMIARTPDKGMKDIMFKYRDTWSEDLGPGMVPESRGDDDGVIDVIYPDTTAIKPQHRLNKYQYAESQLQVARLSWASTIEQSKSVRYAAPVWLVPKKDGTSRMVIDYRSANEGIANHQCDIPLVEDLVSEVVGKKFITAVDLTAAFHQVRIKPECREITTFRSNGEFYQFRLLPFGLKVSPAIMQTTVANLVKGIPGVFNYIDDIVLVADTIEDHRNQFQRLLQRFRDHQYYLKASKCEIMQDEVTFLGHKVLSRGIGIPDDRKTVFEKMRVPQTRKEMQALMGLWGFWRNHVMNFAEMAQPLLEFGSRGQKVSKKEIESIKEPFEKLREAMIKSTVLSPVLQGHPFIIEVDASAHSVGAVLFQELPDGKKHGPVGITLKSLNIHQGRYKQLLLCWLITFFLCLGILRFSFLIRQTTFCRRRWIIFEIITVFSCVPPLLTTLQLMGRLNVRNKLS